MNEYEPLAEDDLRRAATTELKKKQDLQRHVVIYLVINAMLLTVWFMVGHSFFWPIFPIVVWGVGLIVYAWDVYSPDASEARIGAEMDRIRDRHRTDFGS
ncbi:MAG TPA: 2TM domain-containing protein [Microlunatus sp.]